MKLTALIISVLACILPAAHAQNDDRNRENPIPRDEYSYEHQLIFFAVLEGLYQDGVAGEALELMIPNPDTMLVTDHPEQTNFVYNCPLCTAAFNALRLYADRREFYGQKTTHYTTFGPGVSDDVLTQLRSTPQERRDAIQVMIQDWVSRKLDRQALSESERIEIETNLETMKDRGDELLAKFQEMDEDNSLRKVYADWERCPVCEGAMASGKK